MRRIARVFALLAVIGLVTGWAVTRPRPLPADTYAGLTGEAQRGEQVFWAGGCASCHAAEGATGPDKLILSGGQHFQSPFGTFVAPNISSDPIHGIGAWSVLDLGNALQRGLRPDGAHLYPVLPYTAYINATPQDISDLHAYLATLPPDATASQPHKVGFPFNIRRSLGGWKLLFLRPGPVVSGDLTAEESRGRYLAEALAHCGECHTPRNALGGLRRDSWLSGAPNPNGSGTIPDITPGALDWSQAEIAYYLETGFTPEFDTVGGHMAAVVENMAHLPATDRAALAAYLKALAPPR